MTPMMELVKMGYHNIEPHELNVRDQVSVASYSGNASQAWQDNMSIHIALTNDRDLARSIVASEGVGNGVHTRALAAEQSVGRVT